MRDEQRGSASGELLVIRDRINADLSALAVVLVAVHAQSGYPVEGVADPVEWLTEPRPLHAWVAVLGKVVVGHVAVTTPGTGDAAPAIWSSNPSAGQPVGVLGRLFVDPERRGRAIGEHLVAAASDYANESGRRLVLDVLTKDASAQRLYRRLGWRAIGTTQHADGHGTLHHAVCYVSPAT